MKTLFFKEQEKKNFEKQDCRAIMFKYKEVSNSETRVDTRLTNIYYRKSRLPKMDKPGLSANLSILKLVRKNLLTGKTRG